ncbi:MAG: winged helix-turn-helix transcriptional regulator [Clostridia bacterium]|nr:winged helix-turn-helix transcriptional regulator [Clostridia bacterium]
MENNLFEQFKKFALSAYKLHKEQIRKLLVEMNFYEFIALKRISSVKAAPGSGKSERVYLKDISEEMNFPMRRVSQMSEELRDRGLVVWSHDGDGSEGTYLAITPSGKELVLKNEKILKQHFERIIKRYGCENMLQLFAMLKKLDELVAEEFDRIEEEK